MNRSLKALLLACSLCLSLLCGCGKEENPPETTVPTETKVQTEPTEQTTQETTLPPETTEPEPIYPEPDFELAATHAFVYDTVTETMLFSKGGMQQKIAPASLTKLYSAWVALQYLDPETVVTAGEEVTWIDPESSMAYIYQGQQVTVEQCVQGMLMNSGNDAAYILAVAAGRAISENPEMSATAALGVFAGKMNEKALELGLENTLFSNPDGIDAAGHYTSLRDLVEISKLALNDPIMKKYVAMMQDDVTYVSGETATWKNTNLLLHEESQFYCAAACGLKTGSTTNAGKCLISAFLKEDGGYLIIGTLGCPEDLERYVDTMHLYQHYTGQPIAEYEIEPTETE